MDLNRQGSKDQEKGQASSSPSPDIPLHASEISTMLQQARKIIRASYIDWLDPRLYLAEREISEQKGRYIVAFLSTSTKGLELLVGPVAFDAKGREII